MQHHNSSPSESAPSTKTFIHHQNERFPLPSLTHPGRVRGNAATKPESKRSGLADAGCDSVHGNTGAACASELPLPWCGSRGCWCHPKGWVVHQVKRKAIRCCCSRWRCPVAAKYKRHRLRKRLSRVRWLQSLTLTLADDGSVSRENLDRTAACINQFMKCVRARVGRSFIYVWVRERGELYGRLHFHVLWTAGYIPWDWLSATAQACGFGWRVWVNSAKGYRNSTIIENYISKAKLVAYVSKTDGAEQEDRSFPPGARIVQTSGVPAYESEDGWVYQELEPDFTPKLPNLLLLLSITAKLENATRPVVLEPMWAKPYDGRAFTGQEAVK